MTAGDRTKSLVLLGRFGAPHGVRGEIRLQSFTSDPLSIAAYDGLTDKSGTRHFRLRAVRRQGKDMLVAQIEGVDDRAGAEALNRVELYVARDKLPAPEEDEFYIADLIGLRAQTPDGAEIGMIVAVRNFGAGDILEIAPTGQGESLLVPFTKAVVPTVDVQGERVVVEPPAEIEADREEKDA
ncbi:MAG: ribosome maturation factor RimM [Phenylobacterium sp.]|uniref:ribosome maturation factor RimM n=1 Tax=Phenylobacterium sp. TaxID=1871053 RepID=UPI00273352CC|nr:ribosome maturation factor RimM [Phenylobacterium sp.]MDP3174897.1 ribosome maturation factor RimM [Phenylobacterium sp.]